MQRGLALHSIAKTMLNRFGITDENKNDANVMLSYLKDKDDIVYVMQGCYIRLNRELSKEEMDSLNHNNIYLKRINIEISPDKLNSKFISIIDNMSAFYNRENDVCCYFVLSDNKEIHYLQLKNHYSD